MIVGHAMIAFAIVAGIADAAGRREREALLLGAVAGGFALVPDVDMVYAVVGLLQSDVSGIWSATAAFWGSSQEIHRAVTHSLVIGIPAAIAFTLATSNRRGRFAAASLLTGVVVMGFVASGPLGAAVLVLFAVSGTAVAVVAASAGVGVRAILLTALVGLLTHPFGDVFTGQPPWLFYPIGPQVLTERVAIIPDPTLNLLAIFGLELATIWLAGIVVARIVAVDLRAQVDWRSAAGAGYAVAAVVMPAPTLDVSYHFVFSVLAVGTVGVAPLSGRDRLDRWSVTAAVITGLTAISIAGIAYTGAYVVTSALG